MVGKNAFKRVAAGLLVVATQCFVLSACEGEEKYHSVNSHAQFLDYIHRRGSFAEKNYILLAMGRAICRETDAVGLRGMWNNLSQSTWAESQQIALVSGADLYLCPEVKFS